MNFFNSNYTNSKENKMFIVKSVLKFDIILIDLLSLKLN